MRRVASCFILWVTATAARADHPPITHRGDAIDQGSTSAGSSSTCSASAGCASAAPTTSRYRNLGISIGWWH
jgi:hypothetical protein